MILHRERRSKYYRLSTLLHRLPEASQNAPMSTMPQVAMIPMRKNKQFVHYRQFPWPVEDPHLKIAQPEPDEIYERTWKPSSLTAAGCSWPRSQKSIKCVSQLGYEILESNCRIPTESRRTEATGGGNANRVRRCTRKATSYECCM
jgi:hypothetical protein